MLVFVRVQEPLPGLQSCGLQTLTEHYFYYCALLLLVLYLLTHRFQILVPEFPLPPRQVCHECIQMPDRTDQYIGIYWTVPAVVRVGPTVDGTV